MGTSMSRPALHERGVGTVGMMVVAVVAALTACGGDGPPKSVGRQSDRPEQVGVGVVPEEFDKQPTETRFVSERAAGSFEELVAYSDLVVRAEVVAAKPGQRDVAMNEIPRLVTVRVNEVVLSDGPTADSLVTLFMSGWDADSGRGRQIEGVPWLNVGDDVWLFLEHVEPYYVPVVSFAQIIVDGDRIAAASALGNSFVDRLNGRMASATASEIRAAAADVVDGSFNLEKFQREREEARMKEAFLGPVVTVASGDSPHRWALRVARTDGGFCWSVGDEDAVPVACTASVVVEDRIASSSSGAMMLVDPGTGLIYGLGRKGQDVAIKSTDGQLHALRTKGFSLLEKAGLGDFTLLYLEASDATRSAHAVCSANGAECDPLLPG